MSVPVATERKSFLPLRLRATDTATSRPTTTLMPSVSENNKNSSLTVGSRVLVNGLKSGTLRYIGSVQFAQGLFCGVELDQPDGKHDGQVKEIRYFQCPENHGVFVPRDKVMLAPRARISSTQRPVSRLKAPTMTRSITLSSSINQIEQPKSIQLPDIVPNSTITTLPVSHNQTIVKDDHHQETIISTESQEPTDIVETKIDTQPVPIDEPCETIEADFTDSVSLILHQLQQEQQPVAARSSSVRISEEESDDDDEDDDDDDESVMESVFDEQNDTTHHSSLSSIFIPAELTKSIQTDISFHSNDQISFTQVQATNEKRSAAGTTTPTNKTTKSTPQPIKKNIERRLVAPVAQRTPTTVISRKPTIIPPKKGPIPKIQLNPAHSVTSLSPRSKAKLSTSNSLASSQSDLATTNKNSNSKKSSDKTRKVSQSIDLQSTSSDNKSNETLDQLNALEQQLTMQKTVHRSLQTNNEQLEKDYQYSLKQLDLMYILTEYFLNEDDQIKEQHQRQIAQARILNKRLKTTIESLQESHKKDLSSLDKQYQLQIETLKKLHEQQSSEHQQKTVQFHHDKTELESRCSSLQEKIDGFLTEMANSEHADVLLCHVETLEKDRTSLHTVLEMRSKELTQLRTKVHEQEIQLENKQAIEKRVEMTENRNQQLSYRLRQIQMTEKVAVIERDEFKERVIQLERDNCQLKFENETLRYRLRQRALSISTPSDNPVNFPPSLPAVIPCRKKTMRHRACSLSARLIIRTENGRTSRSLSSLNCILYR